MQIKYLKINSYNHLQDLELNLTYPEGHIKAGKPLEKICIIGQSATGKTSILELIKNTLRMMGEVEVLENKYLFGHYDLKFDGNIIFTSRESDINLGPNQVTKGGYIYQNLPGSGGGSIGHLIEEKFRVLYLSSELITPNAINVFNENPLNLLESIIERFSEVKQKLDNPKYTYEFGTEVNSDVWFSLLYKILIYRKKFTQIASELINKGAIGDFAKLNKEYKKWSDANENPLLPFAEKFNPLLSKINLEIDLINTEFPIPIKSKLKDEIIPISKLSTGTKGLLLSMFPLFELDTSDSIILIDEPERSLFPDIQIELMKYYQNLAPTSQIIVATHSPFIAAAFEPEERFILFFDSVGNVSVRRGESPIGDDPNDILRDDFNVDYYNEFGKEAYRKYTELKQSLSVESDGDKKKELLKELSKLGDKYNF